MNGKEADLDEVAAIAGAASQIANVTIMVALPATLINRASGFSGISIGAQNCHTKSSGAHTGDLSAEMLADAGASHIIVGHSERRADHHETDDDVHQKAAAVHAAGLTAIMCIGETREQYASGHTIDVLARQVYGSLPESAKSANTIIAYEPVWAIGTGLIPSLTEIQMVHQAIRTWLPQNLGHVPILYGGSVTKHNARDIFDLPHVDGALVGGASLSADAFVPIIHALGASSS
jgi:triosephosphate isomerase